MILNYLRNKLFWLTDFVNGGEIKNHLKEVTSILDDPNSINSLNSRQKNLDNILLHATKTTKFYKNYNNSKKIEEFPVISKSIIQVNFDDFKSSIYLNKNNYKVATSGSTGTPFFLYQDKNKRNRNTSDIFYFLKLNNYTIGDRLYQLEVWRDNNKKGKLKSWAQNVVQFDVSKLTDSRILYFLKKLKTSKQKKVILGFASSYESICRYLDKVDYDLDNFSISSIIANSEYLNHYTKTTMSKYFNAEVLSRYSSEELGILAHQTIKSPEDFIINCASYHVEILDMENDKPARPGSFGRIVVTDLFNYCMPMIRYDTGDIAKLNESDNDSQKLKQIEGRKMDLIYDSQGNIVSSFIVYTKFYKYYKLLKQYQFIQEGEKKYTIKLNIFDKFLFEKELIDDIKKDFGNDAIVKIVYVNEIPTLSSGKRKKVVNNYKR
ncbi:phenylacetate--CoA ligase family protein [Flavobacteriaceae bacterium AH-315-B10]|nr:phenylacetate--CoA ligase family protein [Flavobacteriaceae bacterium AH-315-B10]